MIEFIIFSEFHYSIEAITGFVDLYMQIIQNKHPDVSGAAWTLILGIRLLGKDLCCLQGVEASPPRRTQKLA